MSRITLVDLVVAILMIAMILCVGFAEGGNYIGACVCLVVAAICSVIAKMEGGRDE